MKNYADRGGCYPPRLKAEVDNILRDLHNSSHHTKVEFNNCFIIHSNISKFLTRLLLVVFLQNFGLFLSTVSGYNQASVVQRLDSTIHRINHYPADSAISFPNTYPLDSDFYPVDSAIQLLNNRGQLFIFLRIP